MDLLSALYCSCKAKHQTKGANKMAEEDYENKSDDFMYYQEDDEQEDYETIFEDYWGERL